MITKDTRKYMDATEYASTPRDYRFVIEVDIHDVIEHEARQKIAQLLTTLHPDEIKVCMGHTNPDFSVTEIVGRMLLGL